MQSLVLPLCTTLAASLPRQLTHSLLLCPLLPCTWLSSSFSGLLVQSKKLASAPLPAAAPWFPLPAVRAAPFSHSAPSHCLLTNCQGKGLPGACLVWCLCSRCSALNYTLLHGTSSTWFVPKPLAYNSLHFAREAVVLVEGCEPRARGFHLPLCRTGPVRNLPINVAQATFFSGACKLSKPCPMCNLRWKMPWLITISFCGASMNTSCAIP